LYAVAWQVAEFTAFGMNAVNIIAAPMIASLHAERRHADLQQLLSRGMAGGLVFALLVGTAILLAGRPLLGVFGPAFGRALPALRILVAGQVLSAACGPVWYLLTMTGHQVAATKAMALSACATVLMAVLLIPTRGLTGAALAGAGGTLLWSCLLYGIAICRLGVDPGVAGLVRWRQSDSFGAGRDERVP
jgi:O-antigen/teichoic acid export membrane protein